MKPGMWWKGSGSVAPSNVEDGFEEIHEERRGLSRWIRKHPVISSVSITFLILGLIAVIVVPITCSIHGCPPKKQERIENPLYDGAPFRLVVAFSNLDVDVADLVPKILQSYTSRVRMLLSNIQILEAVDEVILNAVISEIKKRTDIELLVRDFVLRAPTSVTEAISYGGSRRRLQQTSSDVGLNDPLLSRAYWFNKINVTGAWQLLGVNMSNPQQQLSDVVIAVTDSGANVTHPDLLGSFWNNPDEIDGDLADNDNNIFIDDFYGACFSTSQCSPTYSGNNGSTCGIGRNTSSWNNIVDRVLHGTRIAGVIGAQPNNGIGIAGVAPCLRQMILKVTDETFNPTNPPYAFSDVVRAVDYAYGKGARIFSMSFGPNAKSSFTAFNKPGLDAAAFAYKTLFTKYNNALFVAAAGNEWTSLDTWRDANYTYPPCMVTTPNVLCVGGTTVNDTIFYAYLRNQDVGTNYGPNTVDMSAPGMDIFTTDQAYNFSSGQVEPTYISISGTSFSTPMVAAAAGLVLTALGGQSRATSSTPAIVKNLLVTNGDLLPSLQGRFRSGRRLNVGNAVAAALVTAQTNRTVVKRTSAFESVNTSVAFQGWEYTWWNGTYLDSPFDAADKSYNFVDFYVRNQPTSNFNVFRYSNSSYKMMATTMARIDTPGFYSIQYQPSGISSRRWQLTVGENPLVWGEGANDTVGTVELIFPEPGFYEMTLWMFPENSSSLINFSWLTPLTPTTWSSPSFCWVLHSNPPSSRYYDPNIAAKPALWHVVWNEAASWSTFDTSNRGYFELNKSPLLYRGMQTTVTELSFANGTELRNALYGTGGSPSKNQTVVYGYARANLKPMTFSSGISFRLQGPHTRLYINDQLVFDFQHDSQVMTVSPCVTLQANLTHEVVFYFAARVDASNPVGLMWANCTGTEGITGTSSSYISLSNSLATNFFWAPTSIADLPRGFRCDAWPINFTNPLVNPTPAFGTPAALTWVYPRDCPASYRNGSECKMQTKLKDLFPNVTWTVWSIRCYTYYAGSLNKGITGALVPSGIISQNLAGVRVYYQGGSVFGSSFAPVNTRFPAGVYQLYVIEWTAINSQWNLLASQMVYDGATGAGSPVLTTNSTLMILPPAANATLSWREVTSA
uniref:Subtilisin-like serine protease n=1 Tax=Volvox carteri TaxID=3067 RepID=A0JBW9_VOLCA|nr:Subtilisin-like serine protease [Volvox carteri]